MDKAPPYIIRPKALGRDDVIDGSGVLEPSSIRVSLREDMLTMVVIKLGGLGRWSVTKVSRCFTVSLKN